jgi:hypothetical protein
VSNTSGTHNLLQLSDDNDYKSLAIDNVEGKAFAVKLSANLIDSQ